MKKWLALLLILGLTVFVVGCSDDDDDDDTTNPPTTTTVLIGGLVPVTGNLSQYSEQLETFIHFAEEDVNTKLANNESDYRIELLCQDTETDGEVAKITSELLHRVSSVNCFVGPLTSGELLSMTESTVMDSIIVLSPGSTAPTLSIPNDNIFRFVTSDSQLATALSQKMYDDGIRSLIKIHRFDTWGISLNALMDESFTALGGDTISTYELFGARTSEIVEMLDTLYADIAELTVPIDEVALQLTSLQEGIELMRLVSDSLANYPLLGDIRWYGSDGLVQNAYMVQEESVREFAAQVQYTAPIFGLVESDAMSALATRFAAESNEDPWTYSFIAYDIVSLIGEAILNSTDPDNIIELRTEILNATSTLTGVTGSLELNDNGDRMNGNYDFWQVVEEGGNYSWEIVTE